MLYLKDVFSASCNPHVVFFIARHREMVKVTGDAVESLHDALLSAPDIDTTEEQQPVGLKVTLMDHQCRGLAWLCWRETQLPPGGILGKSSVP